MHTEQRARAQALLHSCGIARALFANPYTVTWLTGFTPPVQLGPSPFAGGPPLVWYDAGEFTLIILDLYLAPDGVSVIRYPGITIDTPIPSAHNLTQIVRDLTGKTSAGALGVEVRHLPTLLAATLASEQPIIPVDGWFDPLRMIKTAEELSVMRRAFALTDLAQAAAREATQVEAREIDVWVAAHAAVEQAAGQRIPLGNDCVVSYRENNIGGWPGAYELRPGDSMMVDLSTIVDGYWSDSCATYYAGEPNDKQRTMHRVATEALEFALSLVKPGLKVNELDRQVRQFIAQAGYPVYPHHTGHGIGVCPHEEPRIVPYNPVALEPGMVIMLEPGIYFP